jgi:putative Holliday junction resolvase
VDLVGELVREYHPEIIVVGLAVREDGSIGPEAREHRRCGERLEQRLGLPVVFHDERYTTRMATRVQRELGVRGRKARRKVHSLAACHLLTDFLDHARLKGRDAPFERQAPGE